MEELRTILLLDHNQNNFIMRKLLVLAKLFFSKKEIVEKTIDGIENITKSRIDKKKVTLCIIIVLALLTVLGVISEETFVELFKDVN